MKEKDFISNADKIRELSKAYPKDSGKSKGLFGGKKIDFDKINNFGDTQNKFNGNVCRALDDTNSTLEEFFNKINTLETKLTSVVQQNEALKSRINALQKNDLLIVDSCIKSCSDNTKLFNDYIRKVNPEMREGIKSVHQYKEVSAETLADANNIAKNKPLNEIDFNAWEKSYKDILSKQLQNIGISGTKNIIAVICTGFLKTLENPTVKNDAIEVYNLLRKSSIYNIKFISIEQDLEHPVFDGDFLCIPSNGAGSYINVINPDLCVICNDTAKIFSIDNWSLIIRKCIVKLTNENPFNEVSADLLEELRHLNDFGLHKYIVQSKDANSTFIENGFHEPIILNDNSKIVDVIENSMEEPYPKGIVTLRKWKSELEKINKSFVKGYDQVVKYFTDKNTLTQNLDEYTLKCFNFLELLNIDAIIKDRFEDVKNLTSLGITFNDTKKYSTTKSSLDILNTNLDTSFNIITCFEYLEHFEYSTRKELYKKFSSALKDNGLLILDIPNKNFELSLKLSTGWQKSNVYSVVWDKQTIIDELKNNGFKVRYIIPTGQNIMPNAPEGAENEPITWTIGAVKI